MSGGWGQFSEQNTRPSRKPDFRDYDDGAFDHSSRRSPNRHEDDYRLESRSTHSNGRDDDWQPDRGRREREYQPSEPRKSFFDDNLYRVQLPQEDYTNAPQFQKYFYTPYEEVEYRHPSVVSRYRQEKQITVYPIDSPNPITNFEETGLPEYIMETLRKANFVEPTPIQAQGWPIALSGYDLIGLAETGSGKTLAYMIPAIIHMLHQPELNSNDGPICLIMAPTRELSCQILEECNKFGKPCGVKSTCAYGGAPKGPQVRDLCAGVHLLVATPGRLIDLLDTDEADRMLDMGFEPQIRKIVHQIRPDRQTVLWSATWPRDVEDIAVDFLIDPFKVTIGSENLRANHNIIQKFQIISMHEKLDRLVDLLNHDASGCRTLIFCQTKRSVDDVTRQLRQEGWPALSIHGDKAQPEREWVLQEFKSGQSPILIATDVAARGLDIKDVKCVVNYDMPSTGEDYVHRIGRTGRAGAQGVAYSFFTNRDARIVKPLIHVIREAGQEVPPELERLARRDTGFLTGANACPVHERSRNRGFR